MWDQARQRPRIRRALHAAGITTVRELGNVGDTALRLARQIASRRLAGPRVFAVGPVFTAPFGMPAATEFGGNLYLIENATRQVSDQERAREEVRRLVRDGADGIAAVLDAGVVDRLPRLAPDVLRAAAAEAHRLGVWVAVSTGRRRDIREAIEAGADTIQYGPLHDAPLDPETVSLLAARDVTYVPVLAGVEEFLAWVERDERPDGLPAETWRLIRERVDRVGPGGVLEPLLTSVHRASTAGVRLGTGTSARTFGPSLHRELELLVAAGLSPTAALLAATRDAARAVRAERDLGTLAPGKLADLVVVAGRPWERIGDVREVRLVVQGGRVVVDHGRTECSAHSGAQREYGSNLSRLTRW
jgi:enamidase